MRKKFPLRVVGETGDVQGGRQRSPYMIEGREVPYLRVANVFDGYIDFTDVNYMPFTDSEIERFRLGPNDILLNEGQSLELVGRCAMYMSGPIDCCFQNTLIRYRSGPDVYPEYALQLFRHCQTTGVFSRIATKTNSIAHLGLNRFAELELPFPSLQIQRRIAEILRTWDDAIEKTEKLISRKLSTFDHWSLMLLSGRKRIGKRSTNWQSVSLSDVTLEATERNKGTLAADAVMGVNKGHGMIPMKDHVRADDLSRYKIVRPGAFAYNPMRLNIGSIAQNHHGRVVLVSPDYVAFETKPDLLVPAYFDHLRRTSLWSRFVKSAGSGGVRIRIYYDDLADFILELPPLDEQARIVDALDTGRCEISLLEQQRDALTRQKRGLMQKLLTGEWPVKVPASKEAAE
ncbi:MAG: restriction endonuclease subunit S [Hyphomicrobium sp.]|nr:restriction endonuclease subunit S [Hyphomicrobium sp.]